MTTYKLAFDTPTRNFSNSLGISGLNKSVVLERESLA